jgi:hypothetical protein
MFTFFGGFGQLSVPDGGPRLAADPGCWVAREVSRSIMLVGHVATGLAVKVYEPRLNLGVLLIAALFSDLLLWALVLFGLESVAAPQSIEPLRFFTFFFPYSHGLPASIFWSLLAATLGWLLAPAHLARRLKLAWALALAVFSHFVLDLLVHVPDLPVIGQASPKLGLGLWRHMPVAVLLEVLLAVFGLVIYLRAIPLSRARAFIVGAIVVVTAVLTAAGPYIAGPPPGTAVLAVSSLATLLLVVLVGFFIEGRVGVAKGKGSRQ